MGTAASISSATNKLQGDVRAFVDCFADLCERGDAGKAARRRAWPAVDPNSNGLASLAECDGWIKATLEARYPGEKDTAHRLFRLYRPSYLLAFNDAKDVGAARPIRTAGKADTDDYVTRDEFRLLAAYLCLYAAMLDAFALIDGRSEGTREDDDRRIDAAEFRAGMPAVVAKGYGFVALQSFDEGAADELFDEIDADKKGKILLTEWCKWIERTEVGAKTAFGLALTAGDDEIAE